jgi:hypothetical protein
MTTASIATAITMAIRLWSFIGSSSKWWRAETDAYVHASVRDHHSLRRCAPGPALPGPPQETHIGTFGARLIGRMGSLISRSGNTHP